MSDIALDWELNALTGDFVLSGNDLQTDDGLRTALVLSLFTDRRAEDGDTLPDGETNRRGWWADSPEAAPIAEGDKFGSRLWLLARSKETPDILARAEDYTREALQWLIDDRVATSIAVAATFLSPMRGVSLAITITRPTTDPANFRFNRTWVAEAARP